MRQISSNLLLHDDPASLPGDPAPLTPAPGLLFAGLSAGVLILRPDGEVIAVNDVAQSIFHCDPMNLGSTALLGLVAAEQRPALAEAITGRIPSPPIRVGLPNGRVFELRTRPGDSLSTVVTLSDVSRYVADAERAARDTLTGLPNRRALQERLGTLLDSARTGGTALAMLCIDLDRFKSVNDTLGHLIGDALLIKVADRFRSALRSTDLVARLGGDEFAILQPGADQPEAAEALARRLVDLISRTYVCRGHMLDIGVSIGIALAPAHGSDGTELLKNADLALYRAKSDGRGTFRVYEPTMSSAVQARRLLEGDLRRALALRQFELAYQPQIGLRTGSVSGFEALLRWRTPERGLVSPAEFIPLAEEIGLIGSIGDWVLRTACRAAASWHTPASIAVNISPLQFRKADLVPTVASALETTGLLPCRLELEITEGALLDNTSRVLEVLHALKALGVRISMDDFGTGYSSLSYLQKFPFDKIKIDQSFIRTAGTGAEGSAIVRAVASLGTSLGIRTTAEGVETAEQLARVRIEGCTEVQGFLTGRPMSALEAAALLVTQQPADAGKGGPA